jgi:hypothetical protein
VRKRCDDADEKAMRLVLAVAVLPLALVLWQHHVDSSTEGELAPVVSAISGRSVEVECQSYWASLLDAQAREGEVRFGPDGTPEARVFLTHATCMRLRDFSGHALHGELDCLRALDWAGAMPLRPGDGCYERASPTIYAVLVLAHEAFHTTGVTSESAANCYAIQAMAWAAAALGADDAEAELLAFAMARLEPFQSGEYATTECRSGTELDLHPDTSAFPTERPLAPPGIPAPR